MNSIIIHGIISESDAKNTINTISALPWHPGDNPNPEYREKIKRNEELKAEDHKTAHEVCQRLQNSILNHREVRNKLFPYKMVLPSLNRYSGGGSYNRHADHALQGTPHLRSDISMTLFLSDPADYEGGVLTLEYTSGETVKIKKERGTIVFYPSDVLHYVTPVTKGTRYAAVSWMQSHIRSVSKRKILAETAELGNKIRDKEGLSEDYISLQNIYQNLYRMWVEL